MLPIWQSIRDQFIEETPDELALCDSDCGRQDCTQEEWLICERRSIRDVDELRGGARSPADFDSGEF